MDGKFRFFFTLSQAEAFANTFPDHMTDIRPYGLAYVVMVWKYEKD